VHDPGGTDKRIVARLHRRCAGMTFLAAHGAFEPANALNAANRADGLVLRLKNGALLDMGFEEGLKAPSAAGQFTLIANPVQLFADGFAVTIRTAQAVFLAEDSGENA